MFLLGVMLINFAKLFMCPAVVDTQVAGHRRKVRREEALIICRQNLSVVFDAEYCYNTSR